MINDLTWYAVVCQVGFSADNVNWFSVICRFFAKKRNLSNSFNLQNIMFAVILYIWQYYKWGQGVMEQNSKGWNNFQRLICDCADELRDYWLSNQSARAVKEIMSLSISQQRMMRKVWRMNAEQPDGVMLKELAEKLTQNYNFSIFE